MSLINTLLKSGACVHGLESTRQALPVFDLVRWRKPRWVPRAKSKEFVLSKRPEQDPQEMEWLKTEENHYRTQMKAIWQLIKLVPDQSLPNPIKVKADKYKIAEASWQDMQERMKVWNSRVAVLREEAEAKKYQEKQGRLLGMLGQEQVISEQFTEETVKRLNREKEVGFLTPDNVEQRLLESLETSADYDFAIDRDGVRVVDVQKTETKKPKEGEKTD
ncbi:small ribosomal subunit protein mS26-like isoform X1 [Saccostrea echinata]|uniref:small ribosomal subunit protein mS26-like isoform X1 n=1 Tax=Saccostrea echinata TaxID=191078 RepID=UPI002A82F3A6|nr:small ribosomal subunit protein mS26-like isoform X1 [Saccostrea echinata]